MKKHSLSFELEGYLRAKDVWIHSAELEDFARSLGFKSSNSGRRLREMYNEGLIEREYRLHDGVRVVWYKFKMQPDRTGWPEIKIPKEFYKKLDCKIQLPLKL